MQVSVETMAGLERKMTVELPSENIDTAIQERLQSLAKTTRMNGFRPGKVPFKVVKKRFEPQVRGEILGDMINRSFYDAVAQEKLRPAGQPTIEPLAGFDNDADHEGFSYTAVFEVYPEFEPKFDSAIKVERPVVVINDSDVDTMVDSLRKQRLEYIDADRPAALEDQVNIDFVGTLDGVEFEGGQADDAPLVLGSGAMIPGFEDQLVGVTSGEQKTISVTFPEEYGSEELAGKDAEFAITVRSIKEPALPKMTEEMIKSFGIEDGQMESLRADIRKNMERELKQRVDARVKQQVMDGLLELNEIDVPKALAKQEIGRLREQLAQQMPPEAVSDASDENRLPDELFTEEAGRRVRLGLVIGEIVRHKSIQAQPDAVRAQVETIASSYQDPQSVIDYYYGNPELLQNVESLVLEEAVTQTIIDNATVTDLDISFQEMMNPPAADDAAS